MSLCPMECDICGDLMEIGEPHYCPEVDDRYDSGFWPTLSGRHDDHNGQRF